MQETQSPQSYGKVAKFLHWMVFILLVIEFTIAWTMHGETLANLHFSFGLLILAVIILRILWRLTHTPPPLPEGTPKSQALLAHAMHYGLYGALVIMPLSGWASMSAFGVPIKFFGLFTVLPLVSVGSSIGQVAGEIHQPLGITIAFLIGAHVLAALYHHFKVKDNILRRMLPQRLGGIPS